MKGSRRFLVLLAITCFSIAVPSASFSLSEDTIPRKTQTPQFTPEFKTLENPDKLEKSIENQKPPMMDNQTHPHRTEALKLTDTLFEHPKASVPSGENTSPKEVVASDVQCPGPEAGVLNIQSKPSLLMLNFNSITLFKTQINHLYFVESVHPPSGDPWDWQVSGLSGFAPTAAIWFEYENDATGQYNENHTEAILYWSGFQSSEWQNGAEGSFTLTLTNGVDSDRVYTIYLALRQLLGTGYTVFEQQNAGGSMMGKAPASGGEYSFTATGISGIVPAPTLTLNNMGAVTSCSYPGLWNQDGTFTLTVQDGTRPDSIFYMPLSLRSLVADGYTIFEQQTSGGDMVNAAGAEGFSISTSSFSGFSPAPATFNLDDMGAVTACSCANWNQDGGSFDLDITDGTRPVSYIFGVSLSLRSLVADGYTVFDQQTSGGDMANAAGAEGFAFAASGYSGLSPAPTALDLDDMGAVTACSCANWNQNGTFTLTVQDGTRPDSVVSEVKISLRQLSSTQFVIIQNEQPNAAVINADSTSGIYYWSGTASNDFREVDGQLPVISFTFQGGDTRLGIINITGVHNDDWLEEINGSFVLEIKDSNRPDSEFDAQVLLRCEGDPGVPEFPNNALINLGLFCVLFLFIVRRKKTV